MDQMPLNFPSLRCQLTSNYSILYRYIILYKYLHYLILVSSANKLVFTLNSNKNNKRSLNEVCSSPFQARADSYKSSMYVGASSGELYSQLA